MHARPGSPHRLRAPDGTRERPRIPTGSRSPSCCTTRPRAPKRSRRSRHRLPRAVRVPRRRCRRPISARGSRSTTPRSSPARRRRFVSATALARSTDAALEPDPGLVKEGRDLELPPWNKGRYGTAIGRAVHAVLQTVDLATGAGLADLAAAQAAAEGVLGLRGDDRRRWCSSRSTAPRSCRRAPVPTGGRPTWRFRSRGSRSRATSTSCTGTRARPARWWWSTTRPTRSATTTISRLGSSHYRVQGAAYAIAVAAATGERVDRCVFVFLSPEGAREVVIGGDELERAIAEVRSLIRSVRDDPPPLGPVVLADA